MHLDIEFSPKDMGKLLGLKPKSINQKELFLFEKIFGFDLKVTEENLDQFINMLSALPERINKLRQTSKLDEQESTTNAH